MTSIKKILDINLSDSQDQEQIDQKENNSLIQNPQKSTQITNIEKQSRDKEQFFQDTSHKNYFNRKNLQIQFKSKNITQKKPLSLNFKKKLSKNIQKQIQIRTSNEKEQEQLQLTSINKTSRHILDQNNQDQDLINLHKPFRIYSSCIPNNQNLRKQKLLRANGKYQKKNKKIAALNNITAFQDLQEIQLEHFRSESQKIVQSYSKALQQNIIFKEQDEEICQITLEKEKQLNKSKDEQLHQKTQIKFQKIVYHSFQEQEQENLNNIDCQNEINQKIAYNLQYQNVFQLNYSSQHSQWSVEQNISALNLQQGRIVRGNQQQNQQNPDFIECEANRFNILSEYFLSEQYLHTSNNFLNILLNNFLSQQKYEKNLRNLLFTPIPSGNMFSFQVQLTKDILKTQYQLWVKLLKQKGDQDHLLLASVKTLNFNIDKTVFAIEQVTKRNKKHFIGQIQSNFTRDNYTLKAYQNKMQNLCQQNESYINQFDDNLQLEQLANISVKFNRTMYIPNNQSTKQIKYLQGQQNLQQLYQNEKCSQSQNHSIKKISQYHHLDKLTKEFYQTYQIRQSKKTLFMQDSINKNKIIFIGKAASKKYKLMIGENISPLQGLALTIAHVENN